MLKARRLSADDALKAGLVDEVCAEGQDVDELAQAWGAAMTERSRAVLRGQKALAVVMRRSMQEALAEAEEEHMANAWTDPAHWEAVRQSFSGKKESRRT